MICTKCPYNGLSSQACLSCQMPEEYDYRYQAYILDTYDPVQQDTSGSDKVTALDDNVEDALRKILTVITDLTPNELLLIQAICRHESLTEYARKMEKLAKQNQDFSRFRAFQTRKAIVEKFGDNFARALLTKGQKKAIQRNKRTSALQRYAPPCSGASDQGGSPHGKCSEKSTKNH